MEHFETMKRLLAGSVLAETVFRSERTCVCALCGKELAYRSLSKHCVSKHNPVSADLQEILVEFAKSANRWHAHNYRLARNASRPSSKSPSPKRSKKSVIRRKRKATDVTGSDENEDEDEISYHDGSGDDSYPDADGGDDEELPIAAFASRRRAPTIDTGRFCPVEEPILVPYRVPYTTSKLRCPAEGCEWHVLRRRFHNHFMSSQKCLHYIRSRPSLYSAIQRDIKSQSLLFEKKKNEIIASEEGYFAAARELGPAVVARSRAESPGVPSSVAAGASSREAASGQNANRKVVGSMHEGTSGAIGERTCRAEPKEFAAPGQNNPGVQSRVEKGHCDTVDAEVICIDD